MKRLRSFNLILSALALIVVLASFEAYAVHPFDRTKYLEYLGGGDQMEAIAHLTLAYEAIKSGEDFPIIGLVAVQECSPGLWFNPLIHACDFPENCPEY